MLDSGDVSVSELISAFSSSTVSELNAVSAMGVVLVAVLSLVVEVNSVELACVLIYSLFNFISVTK